MLCLLHPAACLLYLAGLFAVFFLYPHPFFLLTTFAGVMAYAIFYNGPLLLRGMRYFGILGLLIALVTVLTNHRGTHVFATLFDRPLTLEALCYSLYILLILGGTLLTFAVLNKILGTGKLLYLTSRAAPQTSFILNMALRYIRLLQQRAGLYWSVQKVRGEPDGGGLPKAKMLKKRSLRDYARQVGQIGRLLNGFTAWMLEDGMQIAETLRAREYGVRRRSLYISHTFSCRDGIFTVAVTVLLLLLLILAWLRAGSYDYFRALDKFAFDGRTGAAYIALLFYLALPLAADGLKRAVLHISSRSL